MTTRHPTTVSRYNDRARQLASRYLKDGGVTDPSGLHGADTIGLVKWLESRKGELAASTWGQYRAALLHAFAVGGFQAALTLLQSLTRAGAKKRGAATSGTKRKSLPYDDLLLLLAWLIARNSTWGHATALWLWSTYLTGLRPIEWARATYSDHDILLGGLPSLEAPNAKATNGRASGYARLMPLDHLTPDERTALSRHVEAANLAWSRGLYDHFYDNCSRLLRQANAAIWPKRTRTYTLTSARHQFAANAKAAASPEEVAALMGHASAQTAQMGYGRRAAAVKGAKGRVPKPLKAATKKVRPTTIGFSAREKPEIKPKT